MNENIDKDYIKKINPSNKKLLQIIKKSTTEDIEKTIKLAKDTSYTWRQLSRIKRGEFFDNLASLIKDYQEEIAITISNETGKSLNESNAEVIESLHMIQFACGKSRESCGEIIASEINERECYVIRKPKGVVAIISPWNFPFAIAGAWNAAPAILEGNTVVFKPSEDSPLTGELIDKLYKLAGFPEGVFNLVQGDGEVGKLISNHKDIDHICFTGSVETGKSIRLACANSQHTTCSCEMGSKSSVIIFEDADLDLAVQASVNSAFKLTGQRCVSASRILIHEDLYDKFIKMFLEKTSNIKIGNPFLLKQSKDFTIGPLINETQLLKVKTYNNLVKNDSNAKILYENEEVDDSGYFINPFVYLTEWRDTTYLKQEVFGPHVAIIKFKYLTDAIKIYNDTKYGLALGVLTNNFKTMKKIKDKCDAGMIYFNLGSIGAESHLPFGGVKSSGYGGSTAAATFDNVVHKISVTVNYGGFNLPQGLK